MMFRPGNIGHLGRLGLVAASQPSLVTQALAILAKYGSAANLYIPGVGAISGITAGNWLDSAGTTAATVDGQVGRVDNARGGVNLTQSTAANRPVLRRGFVNQLLWSSDFTNSVWDKRGTLTVTPNYSQGLTRIAGINTLLTGDIYQLRTTGYSDLQAYTPAAVMAQDPECTSGTVFLLNPQNEARGRWLIDLSLLSSTPTLVTKGHPAVTVQIEFTGAGTAGGWHIKKSTGTGTLSVLVGNAATFNGTVTTQQIIDVGGIPVTTTAPASSTNGSFAWDFVSSDSLTSTLTPGNAGFFCSGANIADSGVLRTLLGAGAGSDASSGVWLARQVSSNLLMLQVGNGTTRNNIGAPYPVATNTVASAGWDASAMFVGINNTETSGAKTVNCTSSNTMNIGVLTGTTNPMLGTIGATIIMPTLLPTVTERVTLRKFIASLSGITL